MRALADITPHREAIQRLASKHRAGNVRLFGSIARGEGRASSDVDLLVHFEDEASLLDLVGLKQDLEALLGCAVDVVSDRAVNRHIRDQVFQSAVPL